LSHKIGVVFDNIVLFDTGKEPMMEGRSWFWVSDSEDMTKAMKLWKNLEEAHRNASNSIVLSL
uniref:MHC class I antigen n=1 Tax=Anisakis simplex TaxID=6269 RepID=A0A0M3K9X0_ANISI